jgi:hypothetical protein
MAVVLAGRQERPGRFAGAAANVAPGALLLATWWAWMAWRIPASVGEATPPARVWPGSRIDTPADHTRQPQGLITIAGVAWAPRAGGGVRDRFRWLPCQPGLRHGT